MPVDTDYFFYIIYQFGSSGLTVAGFIGRATAFQGFLTP